MLLDLDTVIFVSFLAINLAVGVFYSRDIKTVREYAIGSGFSTKAITSTVIATFVGGGFFTAALVESYRQGLSFIIPALAEPIAFILMGVFLVPRMVEFFGSVSVADVMGKFYGVYVRKVIAFVGILICTAGVAMQFKVAINIMELFFGISSLYLSLLLGIIVIVYSSFGGIKSVTFTDILQFLTFGCVLPIIFLAIWRTSDINKITNTLSYNPLFDYKSLLNISHPHFLSLISLFAFFIIPTCEPAYIQRINMAKDVNQARRSFILAGCLSMIMLLVVCSTSIVLFSNNPNLDPTRLLPHIINNYSFAGFKGLACIGIMAIIMSTADSAINTASVLFLHDILNLSDGSRLSSRNTIPLLVVVRGFAVIIGIAGMILAYRSSSILELLGMVGGLYMPIVIPPLVLAVYGFRSSQGVVLMGMLAGALTTTFWADFAKSPTILGFSEEVAEEPNAIVPGIIANLIIFIIAHLLSGRPKGLTSSEHKNALKNLADKRKQYLTNFFIAIKTFNFADFCKKNLPKSESWYVVLGLFSFLTLFSITYSLTPEVYSLNAILLDTIYVSVVILASVLVTYIIWPSQYKSKMFIATLWMVSLAYILIFVPTLFLVVSNFGHFQLIVLLTSMIILALLIGWSTAFLMFVGVGYVSVEFCKLLIGSFPESYGYKIIYISLFIMTALIAFLKPKQEEQESSEEMVEHLSHVVEDQNEQITNLSTLKQTFLMNLQHETNTPITGVYSMSQALGDCYDKLTDKERKKAIATITGSSERLISYANNLIDTSKLMSSGCILKIRSVDLSSLLEEVLRKCKKLYIPKEAEEDREFEVSIEPALQATCDDYYIRKSFENLIINSIQYCKKGKISISLATEGDKIKFIVKDSGIGIPNDELTKIFDPFVTSSKTLTPAGGRGMGLTLVKAAAEIHKGTIMASSIGEGGSIFTLTFPAKHGEA